MYPNLNIEHHLQHQDLGPVFFHQADECPIPHLVLSNCADENLQDQKLPGEHYGKTSKCFNAVLPSQTIDIPYAVCFESKCKEEERVLEVKIGKHIVLCERDFQVHEYPGFASAATFECPRLFAVCPK
mmetsp:Transcript_14317/g.20982  ORF Transcript_14317/g.20982 Transcript_14317/m.20982 type:complete len:128 (-) Transcript_14317:898-1281(-)